MSAPAIAVPPPGITPLDPRVRLLWWSASALAVAAVLLPVAVIDFLIDVPTLPRGALSGIVFVGGGGLAAFLPWLRYRRWGYALRERDLWIRQGVVWVKVSVIPYARLQFVDTKQGPLDRMFGLAQLVVHTAAVGTSGQLPGLDLRTAERLRERLAQVEPDAATL